MAVLLGVCFLTALVSSCADKPSWPSTPVGFQSAGDPTGFGGATFVTSITTTSTIASVDAATRTLELRQADGTTKPYKAGPEVSNFNQFKVGDLVQATVGNELAVSLAAPDAPLSDKDKVAVVRSPNGGPLMNVNTRNVTALVVSLNLGVNTATLQLADGTTKTIKVNPNVNLAAFNPGDKVSVQISEARVLVLEKK